MNARNLMFATTALLAAAILWFPAGDNAQAATPTWSPAPDLCDASCRCQVSLGNETEQTTTPACYDETTMTILTSTGGCCTGSMYCGSADDCSWTVEISVTNSSEDECCYWIVKDGNPADPIYENTCADSFDHQDSDSAPCGTNHLYNLRAEGAVCPHNGEADCLTIAGSVLAWSQRIHCNSTGMDCP